MREIFRHGQSLVQEVSIADCVHFRAWRYGTEQPNIYSDYVNGLVAGLPLDSIRRRFINRIFGTRANDLGDVLGIALTRPLVPWKYPWNVSSVRQSGSARARYTAQENPDIVCHTSAEGVLASHLNREFHWLERAVVAMRAGYLPNEHGFVTLLLLRSGQVSRYIVLDGNHRLAALSALGHKSVKAQIVKRFWLNRRLAFFWPGVLAGRFTLRDARAVFDVYFREESPEIPESDQWNIIQDEALALR